MRGVIEMGRAAPKEDRPSSPASECADVSEFTATSLAISARFGISLPHAQTILGLLRGGAA